MSDGDRYNLIEDDGFGRWIVGNIDKDTIYFVDVFAETCTCEAKRFNPKELCKHIKMCKKVQFKENKGNPFQTHAIPLLNKSVQRNTRIEQPTR